jgi:hypothetical protein
MQPGQYGCGDSVGAQGQRLVDGGDAELGGTCGHGGPGDLCGAVSVTISLDDGHHLRVAGMLAQHPHVVLDGTQIHDGLSEDARCQGCRRYDHANYCPRADSAGRIPAGQCAKCSAV